MFHVEPLQPEPADRSATERFAECEYRTVGHIREEEPFAARPCMRSVSSARPGAAKAPREPEAALIGVYLSYTNDLVKLMVFTYNAWTNIDKRTQSNTLDFVPA
ncbi:hypothetical protein DPMN_158614 [Dreissena polymorpha]|uniref:Uncharacterized protein n=1 Tax=Dreissena polymorpha TaxID=45954 RepID=A0A9D4EI55_DREPO|nr:hypothetical protein DPMN_158614 [Dreissena polymorpha]